MEVFRIGAVIGLQQAQDVDHLLWETNKVSLRWSQVVLHVYRRV